MKTTLKAMLKGSLVQSMPIITHLGAMAPVVQLPSLSLQVQLQVEYKVTAGRIVHLMIVLCLRFAYNRHPRHGLAALTTALVLTIRPTTVALTLLPPLLPILTTILTTITMQITPPNNLWSPYLHRPPIAVQKKDSFCRTRWKTLPPMV